MIALLQVLSLMPIQLCRSEDWQFIVTAAFNSCRCQTEFAGFAGSQSVTATQEQCHECGANFISVGQSEVRNVYHTLWTLI